MGEIQILRRKEVLIMMFLFILMITLFALTYFPSIENFSFKRIQAHRNMVVTNVTKTLTIDQIDQKISNQYHLTYQYSKKKHSWLQREIYDGIDSIFSQFTYLYTHPEYDLAKITFTMTRYKVYGQTVEFISASKITEVHSVKGWEVIEITE